MRASEAIRLSGRRPADLAAWLARRILLPLARARRRRLRRTLVVGITGSSGKTTTKNLVTAVLASGLPGRASSGTHNRWNELVRVMLRARASDRYLVQEIGARGRGSLDQLVWTLEPDVGVVISVGGEHRSGFESLEETAREKAKLVASLPPRGLAVLNADDPRVRAMTVLTTARTVLVGCSPDAELRAENVASAWPQPLRFDLCCGEERLPIETRLHGDHWVPAVLAALAVGREVGIPLAEAAAVIARQPPEHHRLSEVRLGGGITILEDDWKAPVWSLGLAIEVLRRARAARKIVVLGYLADSSTSPRTLYPRVAAQFAEVADRVIVVGPWAHYRFYAPAGGGVVQLVSTTRDAHEALEAILRPGDLVLIKTNAKPLHLERLALARQEGVRCWQHDCGRVVWCYDCRLRFVPDR
jgi:UDP-N-acetylmuramoyl-tripeptide--D-alanyl-D-alanine ligase